MGVQGLWQILDPTSKPIRVETLYGQRLAVDASIWLYQFIKAMRDSKGDVLQGGHLIGFLRRICKLLFYGIKPVFVFDGGVPELKLRTIQARKQRRSDARDSVQKTAEKMLKAQLKLQGLEALETGYLNPVVNPSIKVHQEIPDEYHLPAEKDTTTIDPRLATESEIHDFIENQKQTLDFSKIDINSIEFQALPISLQHEIILDLKTKSRTPSQARVEQMLENSSTALDFSKAQIKNVIHRHTLTDRYHNTLKNNVVQKRVAGARQKEFVLIKNDGSGWEMSAKEVDAKVVADLSGLEGFTSSKTAKTPIVNLQDYVADDVPFDDILKTIETGVESVLSPEDSLLEKYVTLKTADKTDLAAPNLGTNLSPSIWVRNWKSCTPKDFEKTYPNIDEIFSIDILSKSYEALEELKVVLARRIEKSNEEKLLHHTFYLEFVESSLLVKNRLDAEHDLDKAVMISLQSETKVPRKGIVIESESDPEADDDVPIVVESQSQRTDDLNDTNDDLVSRLETLPDPGNEIFTSLFDGPNLVEPPMKSPIHISYEEEWEEIPVLNSSPESLLPLQSFEEKNRPNYPVEESLSHSLPPQTKPKPSEIIEILSEGEEWEAIPSPPIPGQNQVVSGLIKEPEFPDDEFGTIEDPFGHPTPSPLKSNFKTGRRDSSDAAKNAEPAETIDVPHLLPQEIDEYYADLQSTNLSAIRERTESEILNLAEQQRAGMRDYAEVTPQMIMETQELLKLFGIPFLTAPMEAESQCAFLLMNKLVDGIITDDSDVFLFGGSLVYKNLFDSKKYVERFTLDGINEIGLGRSQLIQMAYLLGSDYTTGVRGLGPVASVEIVTNWQSEDLSGLEKFKGWVDKLQKGIEDPEIDSVPKKLRSQCKKVKFPEFFPDPRIFDAYMNPTVEESLVPFVWGEPLLDPIRDFLKLKLNWEKEKVDPIVVPIIKELRQRKSVRQTHLEEFFPVTPKKHKSMRVQNATRGGRNTKKKRIL